MLVYQRVLLIYLIIFPFNLPQHKVYILSLEFRQSEFGSPFKVFLGGQIHHPKDVNIVGQGPDPSCFCCC